MLQPAVGLGPKLPVGVLFDSDMGQQIDAALAAAMLYTLEIRSQARVVAFCTSQNNLKSAGLCDALSRFYLARPLPIGMSVAGKPSDDTPMLTAVLAKSAYQNTVKKLNDTAEIGPTLRNALTAQQDGNGVIVCAGPATDLIELYQLHGAKEWIQRKARALVVTLGAYPSGAVDPRVKADLAAAKQLFAEWPTPIIAVGTEVGQAVPYPAASLDKDFSYAKDHLIVDAYRASAQTVDAPTSALAATLYAVKPDGDYFQLSPPGRIAVAADGRTSFSPAADGKHRYLIVDPAQKERLLKTYVELVSAQPKPRPLFRPKAANAVK